MVLTEMFLPSALDIFNMLIEAINAHRCHISLGLRTAQKASLDVLEHFYEASRIPLVFIETENADRG